MIFLKIESKLNSSSYLNWGLDLIFTSLAIELPMFLIIKLRLCSFCST